MEATVQRIIDDSFRDYTVVAVTHRLTHIMKYDQVALMDSGSLVEVGKNKELLAGSALFAEFYGTFENKGRRRDANNVSEGCRVVCSEHYTLHVTSFSKADQ